MHILPNISKSKGNQIKKFGQLIEYNMRNIFLERSYTKCGGEIFPRPFSENQNWGYKKFIQFIFIVCQVEGYRIILEINYRPLAFTSYKAYLKDKERSITSLHTSFSA